MRTSSSIPPYRQDTYSLDKLSYLCVTSSGYDVTIANTMVTIVHCSSTMSCWYRDITWLTTQPIYTDYSYIPWGEIPCDHDSLRHVVTSTLQWLSKHSSLKLHDLTDILKLKHPSVWSPISAIDILGDSDRINLRPILSYTILTLKMVEIHVLRKEFMTMAWIG